MLMKKSRTWQGRAAFAGLWLTAALTLLLAFDGRAFVYENAFEFTSTADVDGDGDEDLLIVDKSTGNYRVAYQLPNGQYSWSNARASGISRPR